MNKENKRYYKLPCSNIQNILEPNVTSTLKEIMSNCRKRYDAEYGDTLKTVTAFSMRNNTVYMEIYQLPDGTLDPVRRFTDGAYSEVQKK